MNSDLIQTLLRTLLKAGGGYLLSRGFVDHDQAEQLQAAALLLGGIIWGVLHRSKPTGNSNGTPTVLLLALSAALCFGTAGCASSPQKIAYDVTAASAIGVDAAMSAWGDYVAKFHPPVSQEQAVSDAFDKYLLAADTAIDGGTGDAGQALADLVNLIQSFGVTIEPKAKPKP